MPLRLPDAIWNRACSLSASPALLHGDLALSAVILAHSLVMNGGFKHALESMEDAKTVAAIAGFRYFKLPAAANLFEEGLRNPPADDVAADRIYWSQVSEDAIIRAFRIKLLKSPEAFAPYDPTAPDSLDIFDGVFEEFLELTGKTNNL